MQKRLVKIQRAQVVSFKRAPTGSRTRFAYIPNGLYIGLYTFRNGLYLRASQRHTATDAFDPGQVICGKYLCKTVR